MKKTIRTLTGILLSLLVLIGLTACGGSDTPAVSEESTEPSSTDTTSVTALPMTAYLTDAEGSALADMTVVLETETGQKEGTTDAEGQVKINSVPVQSFLRLTVLDGDDTLAETYLFVDTDPNGYSYSANHMGYLYLYFPPDATQLTARLGVSEDGRILCQSLE